MEVRIKFRIVGFPDGPGGINLNELFLGVVLFFSLKALKHPIKQPFYIDVFPELLALSPFSGDTH